MQSSLLNVNSDFIQSLVYNERDQLLHWYLKIKRILPWRAAYGTTPNAYHVLVSEFMLQQTTVQTVIPYFERFIKRFPTVEALAAAPLDEVYVLWQGLGYYSRAKNLHRACQQLCEMDYFPKDVPTLKTLAGVGDYTSAAVSAIAFDQPIMPIDGNVMRVMARLFMLNQPKGPKLHAKTLHYIDLFVGQTNNTYVAQAIMELGALVCKPKKPLCNQCPLAEKCRAFNNNTVEQFPKVLPKPIKPKRVATTFIIENKHGRILIVKRPAKGLFSNMYIFPTTCFDFDPRLLMQLTHLKQLQKTIRHVFSHFDLELTVIFAKTTHNLEGEWVLPTELEHYGMPTLMHKIWR